MPRRDTAVWGYCGADQVRGAGGRDDGGEDAATTAGLETGATERNASGRYRDVKHQGGEDGSHDDGGEDAATTAGLETGATKI